jgi:hypothetical protein
LYASSSTTSTFADRGDERAQRSGAIHVPVGLFGLATNTTRVGGVIAARIAGRSCA